jgi:putative ABC transport system permease protein
VSALLRIAWRNVGRGRLRSAIVVCAIAVGVSACVLLIAWSRGIFHQMADNAVRSRLGHLAVLAPGGIDDPDPARSLPDGGRPVIEALEGRSGVRAAPRLQGDGLVQSARSSGRVSILGVDPEREPFVSSVPAQLVEGTYLVEAPASVRALPPVVIGVALAERLRVDLGDKVVLHVPGEAGIGAFRVRGLFQTASSEFDRSVAYLRLADAQHLLAAEGRVTEVAVALERPSEAHAVQAWLRASLPLAWPGVEHVVLRWQEREPQLAELLELMSNISWILYAVVFIAMAFGIANVLLMAVYERTREFGVLRALGLKSGRLLALVMLESFVLTLVGVGAGLALGVPLVLWLGATGLDLSLFAEGLRAYGIGARIHFRIGAEDLVSPVWIATATALIAALWPAVRAARLNPAEALRRAG